MLSRGSRTECSAGVGVSSVVWCVPEYPHNIKVHTTFACLGLVPPLRVCGLRRIWLRLSCIREEVPARRRIMSAVPRKGDARAQR